MEVGWPCRCRRDWPGGCSPMLMPSAKPRCAPSIRSDLQVRRWARAPQPASILSAVRSSCVPPDAATGGASSDPCGRTPWAVASA